MAYISTNEGYTYPNEGVEWDTKNEANWDKVDDIGRVWKVQRVDDSQWEVAQDGVQYFSPNQHGGRHGTVIRKYYSGNPAGATTALEDDVLGVWDKLIDVGGNVTAVSVDGNQVTINSYFSAASAVRLSLEFSSPKMQLILRLGTAFDDITDTYDAWVEYTLV